MLSKIAKLFKKNKKEKKEEAPDKKIDIQINPEGTSSETLTDIKAPSQNNNDNKDEGIIHKDVKTNTRKNNSDKKLREDAKKFSDFNIPENIQKVVRELKFEQCTQIQEKLLESTLKGIDAIGQAQTGTGKTAAFLITIFSRMIGDPQFKNPKPGVPFSIVLAPTRELVLQITKDAETFSKYTDLKIASIFGGMHYKKQIDILKNEPIHMIIATPGRLIDFMDKRLINFRSVNFLVIDEADRMLDMGFIPDVRKIVKAAPHSSKRQTLFFSATIDSNVKRLARYWTKDAIEVEVDPEKIAADSIIQKVYTCTSDDRLKIIYNLFNTEKDHHVIIFTNMKDEANKLEKTLYRHGFNTTLLTGDVAQKARLKRLEKFKEGTYRILVATDVAGRGIHVDDITHVVNYNIPENPEDYVHRIGRTGRAGSTGTSISFATEDGAFYIPAIEKLLGDKFETELPPEEYLKELPAFVRENRIQTDQPKKNRYKNKSHTKKDHRQDKKNYSDKNKRRKKKKE